MLNALNLTELKKTITVSVLLGFMLSCSDVQNREEPDKLLPKDKMVEIYTDMIYLDAVQRSNPRNFKTYELEPSEHIYNKFKIDSSTLSQNIAYYNLDFDVNSDIYEQVKQNIEKKNEGIDSITKVKDSLKKVKANKRRAKLKDSIPSKKKKTKIKPQTP